MQSIHHQLQLLAHASLPLIDTIRDTLDHSSKFLARINGDRAFFRSGEANTGKRFEDENAACIERLEKEITSYRTSARLEVLEPFKVRIERR